MDERAATEHVSVSVLWPDGPTWPGMDPRLVSAQMKQTLEIGLHPHAARRRGHNTKYRKRALPHPSRHRRRHAKQAALPLLTLSLYEENPHFHAPKRDVWRACLPPPTPSPLPLSVRRSANDTQSTLLPPACREFLRCAEIRRRPAQKESCDRTGDRRTGKSYDSERRNREQGWRNGCTTDVVILRIERTRTQGPSKRRATRSNQARQQRWVELQISEAHHRACTGVCTARSGRQRHLTRLSTLLQTAHTQVLHALKSDPPHFPPSPSHTNAHLAAYLLDVAGWVRSHFTHLMHVFRDASARGSPWPRPWSRDFSQTSSSAAISSRRSGPPPVAAAPAQRKPSPKGITSPAHHISRPQLHMT